MPRKNDIKKQIRNHQRRLQKLQEQRAVTGIFTDPKILIEIEDIEVELQRLENELEKIGKLPPLDDGEPPPPWPNNLRLIGGGLVLVLLIAAIFIVVKIILGNGTSNEQESLSHETQQSAMIPSPNCPQGRGKYSLGTLEFELYANDRIESLSSAYSDNPQLNANWRRHAERVKTYADEPNTQAIIQLWHRISATDGFENEHEGIGLNPYLSSEQVTEILVASKSDVNMYWLTCHLRRHPNACAPESDAPGAGGPCYYDDITEFSSQPTVSPAEPGQPTVNVAVSGREAEDLKNAFEALREIVITVVNEGTDPNNTYIGAPSQEDIRSFNQLAREYNTLFPEFPLMLFPEDTTPLTVEHPRALEVLAQVEFAIGTLQRASAGTSEDPEQERLARAFETFQRTVQAIVDEETVEYNSMVGELSPEGIRYFNYLAGEYNRLFSDAQLLLFPEDTTPIQMGHPSASKVLTQVELAIDHLR